jgi:hypothetical protein
LSCSEKHSYYFNFKMYFVIAHPLNREPVYGEIVGFKSTLNNNYVRGRIHKYLGNNIYSVKHMDNPYKENIKLSEMIELQFEHKSVSIFSSYYFINVYRSYYFLKFNDQNHINFFLCVKILKI